VLFYARRGKKEKTGGGRESEKKGLHRSNPARKRKGEKKKDANHFGGGRWVGREEGKNREFGRVSHNNKKRDIGNGKKGNEVIQ